MRRTVGDTVRVPGTLSDRVGLCATCEHCRIVKSERSTFYLCQRALTQPEFRKYPALPVLRCPGYEPATGDKLKE